jgi:type VI secretion system protein ImpL
VTAHFAAIHKLVTGDKGAAQIDGVIQKLQDLQQKLAPVGEQVGKTGAGNPQAINSVSESAESLRREAAPLPDSIGSVVTDVASGAARAVRGEARDLIESRYQEEVVKECTTIVNGKYPFVAGASVDVPLLDFGRLFGYGGIYDTFFKTELSELVDRSGSRWAWRTDASGGVVGGSAAMLRQFETAEQIRLVYFRPNTQDVEVRFTVLPPDSLDVQSRKFTLDIDGQPFEYRHAAVQPKRITWPGPNPGAAAVAFEEEGGGGPNLGFEGAWAWFRLLDVSQARADSDVRSTVTFSKGGHSAQVPIEAASIRHPFGKRLLQQFRCG